MNKILSILALTIGLAFTSRAQQSMVLTSLAANTVSNLISSACIIDNFIISNATTNNATVYFYDSSNTSTTIVQAAYTSYTQYLTNYDVIWTNEASVLVTNTFSGLYTAPVSNSASTNTRPLIFAAIVPASSTLNKDVKLQVIRGLAAIPNQAVSVLTTYRKNY